MPGSVDPATGVQRARAVSVSGSPARAGEDLPVSAARTRERRYTLLVSVLILVLRILILVLMILRLVLMILILVLTSIMMILIPVLMTPILVLKILITS